MAVGCFGLVRATEAETWTSLNGNSTIEARFIGLWEDKVILERTDGRRFAIRLDRLRGDSRIQARDLAKSNATARAMRIADLREQVASENAPAPKKQIAPPPAPAYQPPQPDASIGEFVQQVNAAISGGHLRVLYDFRPPSYRQDISEIIQLAAKKTSPESFQAIKGTSFRMGDLIVTRRNWLFSSPRFGNFPPAERDKAKWTLLGLANVLQKGLDGDALTLQKLQETEFEQWLEDWDAVIAPHVAEMVTKAELDFDSYTQVVSEGEGTATITTGTGGAPVQVEMVLVEGFWVPKSLADSWENDVATAKQRLEQIPAGAFMAPQAAMSGLVGVMLDQVASADTAEAYHESLDAVLTQADSTASFQQMLQAILSPIQTIITAASASPTDDAADDAVTTDGSASQ